MANAVLVIPIKSRAQLQNIFAAEDQLHSAGIDFDVGFDVQEKNREWMLDWSLSGAELRVVGDIAKQLGTNKPADVAMKLGTDGEAAKQIATGGMDRTGLKGMFGKGAISAQDIVLSNKLYATPRE